MKRILVVAAVAASLALTTGCGLLHTIEPVLTDVVAVVSDAEQVLALIDLAANTFFASRPELSDVKVKYVAIMTRTREGLDAALRSVRAVTELDQAQIDLAFADFRAAYADLSSLVQSLGIAAPAGTIALGPRGTLVQIPVPLAMTYHVQK